MQQSPAQPIVLVIFHCQTGETEKLALSAAVGAVQARAMIRLRRLPDIGMAVDNDELLRMRKEYVPPTEKDILGADGIILVAAPESSETSLQWRPCFELMNRLLPPDAPPQKIITGIGFGARFIYSLGASALTDPLEKAKALGFSVASGARKQKQKQQQEHS